MTLQSKAWFAMGIAAGFLFAGLIPTQAGVISAGWHDSLGLRTDGTLWAWGYNGDRSYVSDYTNNSVIMQEANQLGLNIPGGVYDTNSMYAGYSTHIPTRVGTASSWISIDSSGMGDFCTGMDDFYAGWVYRTFGLQKDGSLWAWGYDGDPSEVNTNYPSVYYPEDYMFVGRGALGLGNLVTNETIIYTNLDTITYDVITNIAHYAASVGVPRRIGADSDWAAVAAGSEHALALKRNGSLWSWGYDGMGFFEEAVNADTNRWRAYAKGVLGLGTNLLVSTLAWTNYYEGEEDVENEYVAGVLTSTRIGTATNWVAAAAGYDHSLAVKSDGSLYAWGQNAWVQQVAVLTDATHYVLVNTNLYGVLGQGSVALRSTNTPTRVGTDLDWAKVAAGSSCSFAIKKDGSLWAWGDNGYVWSGYWWYWWFGENPTGDYAYAYGRLGLGTDVLMTNVPTRVGMDNNWIDISVSGQNTSVLNEQPFVIGMYQIQIADLNPQCLALKSDGTLWAWGYGWYDIDEALGTIIPRAQAVPTRVGTDNDWVAISAGYNHNLALKSNGTLWAMGANDIGQFGNDSGSSFNPVQVGSLFTWGNPFVVGDYNGDNKSDLAVYRDGNWYIVSLTRGSILLNGNWGGPGWTPVPGDYDGDGISDPAVYRDGSWYIRSLTRGNILLDGNWGGPGWVPVQGDYDGDGKSDLAVYSDGFWYIASLTKGSILNNGNWGGPGWTPVPGDYDGDGKSDLAVYSDGYWYIRSLTKGGILNNGNWGAPGWTPVPGDYDGDGKSDLAVYRDGYWYIVSLANGKILFNGNWGEPGWTPVPGDYDGDGKSDLAVYSDGYWYIRSLTKGSILNNGYWGGPGWTPVR